MDGDVMAWAGDGGLAGEQPLNRKVPAGLHGPRGWQAVGNNMLGGRAYHLIGGGDGAAKWRRWRQHALATWTWRAYGNGGSLRASGDEYQACDWSPSLTWQTTHVALHVTVTYGDNAIILANMLHVTGSDAYVPI